MYKVCRLILHEYVSVNKTINQTALYFTFPWMFSLESNLGLSLVAVGQRNGIVPAVILAHSDLPSNQSVQTAGGKCSMLYYTLSTTVSHVKLDTISREYLQGSLYMQ